MLPIKCSTILSAKIAFVHPGPSNESSENNKLISIDLRKRVVITWLWYLSSHLQLAPGQLVSIKLIAVITVAIVQNSTEYYSFVVEYGRLMMRNLAWNSSLLVDDFPLNSRVAVSRQVVQLAQRDAPHRLNRTDFDISASVNIETVILKINS